MNDLFYLGSESQWTILGEPERWRFHASWREAEVIAKRLDAFESRIRFLDDESEATVPTMDLMMSAAKL